MAYGTINGYFVIEYKSCPYGALENLIIIRDYIINLEIEHEYYYTKVYKLDCFDCHESIEKEINLKTMFENVAATITNGSQICVGTVLTYGPYSFEVTYARNIANDRFNIA